MLLAILGAAIETGVRAAVKLGSLTRHGEKELVERLLAGDESAFVWLVGKHTATMTRLARGLVRDDAVAAEVVQETWETVFKELPRFRGDSSLSTWIYRILVNRARRVGKKEAKTVPFSGMQRDGGEEDRTDASDEFTRIGAWRSPVHGWSMVDPQTQAINAEGLEVLKTALEELPEAQKMVVTLRDVQGLPSSEVCELLGISEANQRVLLHRGRTKLRKALETAEKGSLGRESGEA